MLGEGLWRPAFPAILGAQRARPAHQKITNCCRFTCELLDGRRGDLTVKPQRHELTLGRTHETEDAGLRREANHGAVRRVVGSVDDPIRRDPEPEWIRHLPATID